MKTSPAMLGTGKLYWVLFLIPHLGTWSINGEEPCEVQSYVKRESMYVSAGNSFKLECPVEYCANRPNVTWCKIKAQSCLYLGDRHRGHTSWEKRKNISVFVLYFDQALASDNGSYRCSVSHQRERIESFSITIHVRERTQNNSEHPLINTTTDPRLPLKKNTADVHWILYSLLPLGGLPLLVICFYLCFCLRRHQGQQKKPSDQEERGINLVDVLPFRNQQTETGSRQNSQTLPSETRIYGNDTNTGFLAQEESGAYSNPCLEENKQGIVYASLNHSVIRMNPREERNMDEAPTEYAAICMRS